MDPALGWVMDYADLKAAFAPLFETLDHHYLNEVKGLENPTSENLAMWVWERLVGGLPGLAAVEVAFSPSGEHIAIGTNAGEVSLATEHGFKI